MAEKSFSQAINERRATRHYRPTAVQEDDLRRILEAALAALSGYNLQPWRFVVVRHPEQRKRLREAAMGQSKVEEAPAVIVACGDSQGWKNGDLDEMIPWPLATAMADQLSMSLHDETLPSFWVLCLAHWAA